MSDSYPDSRPQAVPHDERGHIEDHVAGLMDRAREAVGDLTSFRMFLIEMEQQMRKTIHAIGDTVGIDDRKGEDVSGGRF